MTTEIRNIDACLAALGTKRFASLFADFIEGFGIDQIMVFSISESAATCLLSRHFRNAALAETLSATYLDGWYRQDPLLPELLSIAPGRIVLRRFRDIETRMSDDYRRIFFDAPGLVEKTTLLAASDRLRLCLNLYQTGAGMVPVDDDLARIAGRLVLMHFSQMLDTGDPAPLAVLSERERHVCLGILSGKKTELIADELGVAPSTVITYRKRAYQKLGITTRAGLFAICRS